MTNTVVSLVYLVTIVGSAVGEDWVYYVLGSLVEAALLLVVVRKAWTWPSPRSAASPA